VGAAAILKNTSESLKISVIPVIGKLAMEKGVNLEMRMERTEVVLWTIQGPMYSWICVMVYEISLPVR
jgi:hypothetical protein